jgi:hypothetical protein
LQRRPDGEKYYGRMIPLIMREKEKLGFALTGKKRPLQSEGEAPFTFLNDEAK